MALTTHEEESYLTIQMSGAVENSNQIASYRWTRQLQGAELKKPVPLAELKQRMEHLMSGEKYSELSHNCHKAQEALRKSLGLSVHD